MLWKYTNNLSKIDHAITVWLKERQELLLLLGKVSETLPLNDDCMDTKEELLAKLHQTVTDYTLTPHLETLQQLIEENAKFNSYNAKLDSAIVQRITENTTQITPLISSPRKIMDNLNSLNELIADRNTLEEKLINEYIVGKSALESSSVSKNQRSPK